MKPEQSLIAERPAARHCPELLRAGPPPVELLPLFARFGARLAHGLAGRLAALSGGAKVDVVCADPRDCVPADLSGEIAPLAANCLLFAGNALALVSFEAAAVFAMIDRAFGGRGDVPDPLPDAFPLSGEMMIGRLEKAVCAAFTDVLGGDGDAVTVTRRDGSLLRLAPFADAEALAVLAFSVMQAGCAPWRITLAVPAGAMGTWFGSELAGRAVATRAGGSLPAFEDMPLPVEAVLVDMLMPFSAISALRPGQVLPVSVARSIPLSVGGRTIAHGAAGAVDDRVAIQITQAF